MITVLLVDDHALVRRGFRRLLEDEPDIKVIGEAGNGREAVELTSQLRPKVVVMDYAMPELDGVQATNEIRRQTPESSVLMLEHARGRKLSTECNGSRSVRIRPEERDRRRPCTGNPKGRGRLSSTAFLQPRQPILGRP